MKYPKIHHDNVKIKISKANQSESRQAAQNMARPISMQPLRRKGRALTGKQKKGAGGARTGNYQWEALHRYKLTPVVQI